MTSDKDTRGYPENTDAAALVNAACGASLRRDAGTDDACARAGFTAVKPGTRRTITIAGDKYGFCYCPPGTFIMGAPAEEDYRPAILQFDDETQHETTLTRGFWCLETLCPQRLWIAMMDRNPSYFVGLNLPVESVSYDDCLLFLAALNKRQALPDGYEFRLLTEAEWEYACRAGTTTPFSWGAALNGDLANCDGRYPYGTDVPGVWFNATTNVKKYPPNPWGLYDMHGNLWEWVSDWYAAYPDGPVVDPTGPESGEDRVNRGGAWDYAAGNCRAARRDSYTPSVGSRYLGFRFVLAQTR